MEKIEKISTLKKIKTIVIRTIIVLLLLLLALGIALSFPVVQTKIGAYVTQIINDDYKTNIKVEKVAISIFGGVKLKNVMIRDHHNDTLIYANRIKTNILSFENLSNGDLIFGDIRLDGLFFNLKTYKKEKESNINHFIALFETGKPATKKFLLKAKNVYLTNSRFILIDENRKVQKDIDFTKIDASLSNFKIYGPDISTKINKMAFHDHRGIIIENLQSKFLYTNSNILLTDLDVKTKYSTLKGDVGLYYDKDGFSDFNNKVKFKVNAAVAAISSNDIRFFYKELGKDKIFNLKSDISGTLNNLNFKNLKLFDNRNSQIIGDIIFQNLFGKKGETFYMKADFRKLNSNYVDLAGILPNVLGKKLPTSLKKLGQFDMKGNVEITPQSLITDFYMTTSIGNVKADLNMKHINNIDNASYFGNIIMDNFNIGSFIDRKDLGIVSFDINIEGSGFTTKNLQTKVQGTISKLYYNKYNYTKIDIDGSLQSPFYKGKAIINDPNLFMDFDGLLDLSGKEKHYNFHANIDYANLRKLNFTNDSIAVFKGDIKMDIAGNSFDNLRGIVNINETSYQNQKDNYIFDDFTLTSSFDEQNVRTISINSPDIIEGKVVGKFQFNQLENMFQNAIGSLYNNYKPNKISKGQFLRFNFSVYNKIIEVFFPGIELASNTFIKGNMNADNDEFKLNFSSPKIKAYDNSFDQIKVNIDNKNPLYNAFIELDSIKTKYYKVSDFSLINVTMKDTMYVRSEFKGGKQGEDFYNLNLYHTIDKANNNVVGIQKSELKFKDYLWFLNENDTEDNKVIFDKKLKNFSIDNINMTHENQKIALVGTLRDSTYKDLNVNFENVNLNKIIPTVDSLKVAGNLDGKINFKQDKNVYQPTASLTIEDLNINNIALGNLLVDVEGDNAFRKFSVDATLKNENVASFIAQGSFSVANNQTLMDLDLRFNDLNLAAFSPLGGNVISNIRGLVSGSANVGGTVQKPDINGRLFLEDAGLKIPYLNTDYDFNQNSIIDLSDGQFIFQNATLVDTKYKTEGRLNGTIKHKNFSNWKLNLKIDSNRLLALDTKDSEDAAYYGTAFIDGIATIDGPTDNLFIGVNAKSSKGTIIKIPINNSEASSSKNFMHYLTPKEKYDKLKGITSNIKMYKGLELQFELDITPEAEIEVILDRETGHGMKAKGNGTLLLEINTLGKFKMTGDYQVYSGSYNFKYRGIIDKKFEVKKFSSISWEGDPMRARLNLEAVYKANANPAVLLDNPSVNRKVPVEVGILISGNLSTPEPDFTINFPTISSVLKSEIETKLGDSDIRQTQALSLLATGGFLSNEGVTVTNNLFETATGLFDDIFQNPDDKVKFGLDIVSAERTPGNESDGSIGFNISTQINERITVNGKVGVPIGGVNESAIIGDVEIQYRVNEDGTMNLRFFNRENDINYIGEGIGYTQGIGITYEVDFDTFKEFINKIFKKKILGRANNGNDIVPDSEPETPNSLNFPAPIATDKEKEEEKNKAKPNSEAIPREDE